MARAPFNKLAVHSYSIIPHPQPKLPLVIANFHFNSLRLRVVKRIAQRLAGNPIDFVPQDWMDSPRSALDGNVEVDGMLVSRIGREFYSKSVYGLGEVVGLHGGGAQILYGITALRDSFSSLMDCAPKPLFRFARARWKQIISYLEKEQGSMKALQQRVVQFPGDPRSLAYALFQTHVELRSQLPQP
jgi:hypothetical protein